MYICTASKETIEWTKALPNTGAEAESHLQYATEGTIVFPLHTNVLACKLC